jgi:hypothetical protein
MPAILSHSDFPPLRASKSPATSSANFGIVASGLDPSRAVPPISGTKVILPDNYRCGVGGLSGSNVGLGEAAFSDHSTSPTFSNDTGEFGPIITDVGLKESESVEQPVMHLVVDSDVGKSTVLVECVPGVDVGLQGLVQGRASASHPCSDQSTSDVCVISPKKSVPNVSENCSDATIHTAPIAPSIVDIRVSDGTTNSTKLWSSLFTSLPRNAGNYMPIDFDLVEENGVMIPPPSVMQAGEDFWSDYLVGFFLNPHHRLSFASTVLRRVWKLRGNLHVKLIDTMYYLKFSSSEERRLVLDAEPSFVEGRPFIVTPWSPTVACAREKVFSIPVWVYFSQIPSVLQPLIGLNWLACNVGKLKCFDSNTVARDKLMFAKALIEISPTKPLPSSISVQIAVGHVVEVRVRYGWVPDICTACLSFGHSTIDCHHSVASAAAPKSPLPRPQRRIWVPKASAPSTISNPAPEAMMPVLSVPPLPLVTPVSPPGSEVPSVAPVTSLAAPVPSVLLPPVAWDEPEGCWIDPISDMRYNPVNESFFRFVSDDHLDLRCLRYKLSGDSLVLDLDGVDAGSNSMMLADPSWDRSFIYCADDVVYDPCIALRFRPFAGLSGSVPLCTTLVSGVVGHSTSLEES